MPETGEGAVAGGFCEEVGGEVTLLRFLAVETVVVVVDAGSGEGRH